jgi:hypothetical protein
MNLFDLFRRRRSTAPAMLLADPYQCLAFARRLRVRPPSNLDRWQVPGVRAKRGCDSPA